MPKNDTIRGEKTTEMIPLTAQIEALELKTVPKAVLNFIATTNHATARKIANNFGITLLTAKRNIALLVAKGLLERVGNNRSGSWIVTLSNSQSNNNNFNKETK